MMRAITMPSSSPMTAPMMMVRARLPLLLLDDALVALETTEGASICCTRANCSCAVARSVCWVASCEATSA